MKRLIMHISIMLVVCTISWAEESRYEVTLQGSAVVSKNTRASSLISKPTSSGGVLVGFRVNGTRWLAFEADYDYSRNSERYFTASSQASISTNLHVITGCAVFKVPGLSFVKPYALAGGGIIRFEPRRTNVLEDQTRGTFVYGGGFDVPVARHVALRAQYRGFVYKVPDFRIESLKIGEFTHTAVPSAGIVLNF